MNIKDNSSIDWNDTLKSSGNDPLFAKQFLSLLIESWTADVPRIEEALSNNNIVEVKRLIHRLRGAVSYSCLPKLKEQLLIIDQALRNGDQHKQVVLLIEQMKLEMNKIEQDFKGI